MIHLHWYTLVFALFLAFYGGALTVAMLTLGKLCDWISDSKSTLWLKR